MATGATPTGEPNKKRAHPARATSEALQFHLEGLLEDGEPLPESLSDDAAVEVLDLGEPRSQAHVALARHG